MVCAVTVVTAVQLSDQANFEHGFTRLCRQAKPAGVATQGGEVACLRLARCGCFLRGCQLQQLQILLCHGFLLRQRLNSRASACRQQMRRLLPRRSCPGCIWCKLGHSRLRECCCALLLHVRRRLRSHFRCFRHPRFSMQRPCRLDLDPMDHVSAVMAWHRCGQESETSRNDSTFPTMIIMRSCRSRWQDAR